LLSRVEDEQKRRFYLTQSLESGWNSRTSKYLLYLPKEEDLISLIEQDRERFALDFDDAETSDES
jgi:predicted nuclease of restriction endonuclease-like (RecB) superfamily